MKCLYCHHSTLDLLINHQETKSVGSDCKPLPYEFTIFRCQHCRLLQKLVDKQYRKRTRQLYENYRAFALTDGQEQLNYSADVPISRCETILKHCEAYLPKCGKVLDIGTGSGVMLSALSKKLPELILFAHDVSAHQQQAIAQFVTLSDFYTGALSSIDEQFDLITLVHVLEHVEDLKSFLADINRLLTPNGKLIIQVPNIDDNVWDFAIFDHIWHFNPSTLSYVLTPWFRYQYLPEQIGKEITLVVGNQTVVAEQTQKKAQELSPSNTFNQHLRALDHIKAKGRPCYVLGTGPSAVFTAHYLSPLCLGFIDEDSNKIGKVLAGLPVLSSDNYFTEKVILPYPRAQQLAIKQRLPHLSMHCLSEEQN